MLSSIPPPSYSKSVTLKIPLFFPLFQKTKQTLQMYMKINREVSVIIQSQHQTVNLHMSWYLFKDAPAVKQRGIKVDGFQQSPIHRPKINLSWGMNEKTYNEHPTITDKSLFPSTFNLKPTSSEAKNSNEGISNAKILTETSEDDEEELIKLIKKRRQISKKEESIINPSSKASIRGQSLHSSQKDAHKDRPENQSKNDQFTKRVRYLEKSLLPICQRDNMTKILDHNFSKQNPLSESRLSNKSNKKNESSVILGDGFNAFVPPVQIKKDFTRQLLEMYEYDEQRRKRVSSESFVLG